jgi:hypothetical protein
MSQAKPAGPGATLPLVRCAVYTRKSTEEGLEQEFNSLDAQRESAEAFVRSQAGEGWARLPDRYDDGGFTGGNIERPAQRRPMIDLVALSRGMLNRASANAEYTVNRPCYQEIGIAYVQDRTCLILTSR